MRCAFAPSRFLIRLKLLVAHWGKNMAAGERLVSHNQPSSGRNHNSQAWFNPASASVSKQQLQQQQLDWCQLLRKLALLRSIKALAIVMVSGLCSMARPAIPEKTANLAEPNHYHQSKPRPGGRLASCECAWQASSTAWRC